MSETDITNLKSLIQQRLVESGEYDRISADLKQKLAESDWYDQVRALTNKKISDEDSPSFTKLSEEIEPRALELVPENIKLSTISRVQDFLKRTVERE